MTTDNQGIQNPCSDASGECPPPSPGQDTEAACAETNQDHTVRSCDLQVILKALAKLGAADHHRPAKNNCTMAQRGVSSLLALEVSAHWSAQDIK